MERADEVLTLAQIQAETGLAAATIKTQVRMGRIDGSKRATPNGTEWVVARRELDRYLRNRQGHVKPVAAGYVYSTPDPAAYGVLPSRPDRAGTNRRRVDPGQERRIAAAARELIDQLRTSAPGEIHTVRPRLYGMTLTGWSVILRREATAARTAIQIDPIDDNDDPRLAVRRLPSVERAGRRAR